VTREISEEKARELLLSLDPVVALGQMQEQLYDRRRGTTPTEQAGLEAMWAEVAWQGMEALGRGREPIGQDVLAQYMVLVMCRDEKQQVAFLERFAAEGLEVKALLS
jgi:hypothetical protein